MTVEFVRVINIPNTWISRSRRFRVFPSREHWGMYALHDTITNIMHHTETDLDAFFKAQQIKEATQ